MNWHWIIALVWVTPGSALYHEKSMKTITVPVSAGAAFGYSISSMSSGPRSKLIVGAPLADNIGQVFTCDVPNNRRCTQIDNTINKRPPTDSISNENYWFGATVLGSEDFFVTCAPRSFDDEGIQLFVGEVGTYGHCFQYNDPNQAPKQLKSMSLLQRKEKNTTLFEETMDSFGWSLYITNDKNVLIGSPAVISGRVIKVKDTSNKVTLATGIKSNATFNFGYAVANGKFYSSKSSIAVGTPYGTNGYGKVVFLVEDRVGMKNSKEVVSPTVGSMFGSVLCPAKLTKGGLTDLLVGAPTYTPKGKFYDVGAAYVYAAKLLMKPQLKRVIVGTMSRSYFGSAINNLGDLNKDHFDEIAIAAPYEYDGRGTVYLYSGADLLEDGPLKPIQTLKPEPTIRTFGYSLTDLRDYDENGCNELAIGAPESNKVMVLRCLASMTIKLLEFDRKIPGATEGNKTQVLNLCFDAIFPEKPLLIKADVLVNIKIHHASSKLASPDDEKVTFNVNYIDNVIRNTRYCKNVMLFMNGETGDYNKKIEYDLTASLKTDPTTKNDFDSSEVLLNKDSVLFKKGSIWAQVCGDRLCIPILNMSTEFSTTDSYLIGSSSSINVSIKVDNFGEVAYDSCVRVSVDGVERPDVCTEEFIDDAALLLCKPNRLIKKDQPWSLESIILDTTKLTNEDKGITVIVSLYSECSSKIIKEQKKKHFKLLADSDSVEVHGRTDEGQDDLVNLTRADVAIQKTFEQVYTLSNSGPTNWVNIQMILIIQKQDFVRVSYIDKICEAQNTTDPETLYYSCLAPKLGSDAKIEVVVRMQVISDEINERIGKEKLTVYSNMTFYLNGEHRNASVTSDLRLVEGTTPIWIIIVACILALIVLIIIFFILRECGFLKRKNKENLKRVRMSVRRQTVMRQSTQNRPRSEDQQALVKEANLSHDIQKKKKDRRVVISD